MPIYEFICEKCDRRFDVLFRTPTERRRVSCPSCKGTRTRKAFSVFGTASGGNDNGGGGSSCSSCARSSCRGCRAR